MNICANEKCTGCGACAYICGTNAIQMKENIIGHMYPYIDNSLCKKCGRCQSICPVNLKVPKNEPLTVYSAWSSRKEERESSSSGGISAEITAMFIAQGGIVYGCTGVGGNVRHIRISCDEDLWMIKGSKYVQSDITHIFPLIESDLISGYKCIFIGTPCQVAAIISLYGKYNNLTTIDLICHGVMSQKLLIDSLNSNNIELSTNSIVSFRNKSGYFLEVFDNGEKIYSKEMYNDKWYTLFNERIGIRDSCGKCDYSASARLGDITLGDFWGCSKDELIESNHCVSVMLINTNIGETIFQSLIKNKRIIYKKKETKDAADYNVSLRHPTPVGKNNNKFQKIYLSLGFNKAYKKTTLVRRIKNIILFIRMRLSHMR